ncbi:Vacuolar protein sorting-associated protein 30 [Fulvia fulva]|uniref:Vacuolar protein sorting-associated protein 30 n=1 Tax=Passalora fulva TaxID=5499 RepID=A0A9Q8LCH0_PASFU|nr:Vacuolar protein sorting-associated protein 30 [Fulvia fulva]KAK4629691.1 Vacuolar protein sorting-associated protein 30 [Fulvia fulva]KAK4630609.1 Vacuolar protein sorting-associated protein 30 [Fulvia fulva]UJO14861.1 Vacuolar protein sorting-associated protein 30 [Fulvia fulva]WPV13066.1 Vacuolar protein sorting-associated protein 30 [Fulvia fulva]WPV27745.1 Vacuolar protein sorting-associated protein 30 [Fulvia fulva]
MSSTGPALRCQKCKTTLHIDGSLDSLNPASFKILADAAPALEPKAPEAPRSAAAKERRQLYNDVSKQAGPPMHKRTVTANQGTPSGKQYPDMSYINISDSQVVPASQHDAFTSPTRKKSVTKNSDSLNTANGETRMSREMESVMRLFEILSARSDIDHPVCSECTEILLEGLQRRQAGISRERDAYVDFLKKAQQDVPTDEEKAKTKRDLEDARQREKQALQELEALEAEKARMEDEIAALDAEAGELDEEEDQFWRERNAFAAELSAFQEERDSLQNQLAHDNKVLEALQRTNVYNDTFCIGHDGTFGTINGLRLGRTPEISVDWPEINAAWGQTLLLLTVVIEKLGLQLKGYELVPIGSTSKVTRLEYPQIASTTDTKPKKTIFELFSSGDLPLGLGFLHRNFDNAMVAFLECLRQIGEHVEHTTPKSGSPGLKMPYVIAKDKIGEVSIKLGSFGQEEQWTKACKYTLTCCKFLLAHASHVADAAYTKTGR